HLKRDRLAGSGRTGHETMAVRKRERKPRRLLALAHKNLRVGIRQIIAGCCHHYAPVFIHHEVQADHSACCKAIEPASPPSKGWFRRAMATMCAVEHRQKSREPPWPSDNSIEISHPLLHWCNTWKAIEDESSSGAGGSLVIR